jgi:hypothetical protein
MLDNTLSQADRGPNISSDCAISDHRDRELRAGKCGGAKQVDPFFDVREPSLSFAGQSPWHKFSINLANPPADYVCA